MKLIRCHIENFGRLQNYTLEFSPHVTTIKEANGFGKSTLAAFLRAMFYGMPRAAKSLEKNDRKRYQPWQGGAYGGWLEFKHEEMQYRVERTFGESPKQDTFALYTLFPFAPSNRFTENLGEEIFGLSVESFDRTTYLSQLQWDNSFVTTEIQAQLTNLIEHTNDAGDFDAALQALRAQRSKYLPYRGKGGTINQAAERITELEALMFHTEHRKTHLLEVQEQLAALEQEYQDKLVAMELVRHQISTAYEAAGQNALAQQYEELQNNVLELQKQIAQLRGKFPYGIPTEDELYMASEAFISAEQAEHMGLYQDEAAVFEKLDQFFKPGVPSEKRLAAMEADVYGLGQIEQMLRQRGLELQAMNPDKKSPGTIMMLLLTIFAGLGTGVLYYYHLSAYVLPACCFTAAMVLITLISAIIQGTRRRKIRRLTDEINTLRNNAKLLKNKLRGGLGPYFMEGYTLPLILGELKKNRPVYLSLLEKKNRLDEQRKAQQETALAQIHQLLSPYYISPMPNSRKELLQLQDVATRLTALNTALQQAEEMVKQFEFKYGQPKKQLLTRTAAEWKKEESALDTEIRLLQDQLTALRQTLAQMQAIGEQRTSHEDEIARLQAQQAADMAKVQALDKTIEHLTSAREALSTRYVHPLKQKFSEYLKQFMHWDTDAINLDTAFNVTLEQLGAQRELGYFSVGEVDMIALCMRFALVDVLYSNSVPLLILDDPFVNLDNKNMRAAQALLDKLGETHQILYLTCHSSRT